MKHKETVAYVGHNAKYFVLRLQLDDSFLFVMNALYLCVRIIIIKIE